MNPEPLIIAIASGKGGVGKTMLSVACAYELSLGGPTLLLDLDFFNRGLAGLFSQGEIIAEVARPDFLAAADAGETEPWRLIRIARDLYHVTFPDLGPAELSGLEISSVGAIRKSLGRFIKTVRKKCGAIRVVLDCHGGPDHTSFAAAMLARHTLLISEPDRITFHGTLNFLRQLDRSLDPQVGGGPGVAADVRLVFNKIVPAFRAPFLRRLYDENLREEFGGFDLLGMFPLELPLGKAFEETPLLTRAYPYSLLARKMRVLLLDLLEDRAKDYLAPSAPTLPGWVRKYRRRTLGRMPWFLDQEIILQIVTFVTFFFMIVSFFDTRFVKTQEQAYARASMLVIVSRHPMYSSEKELLFRGFDRLFKEGERFGEDPFYDSGIPLPYMGIHEGKREVNYFDVQNLMPLVDEMFGPGFALHGPNEHSTGHISFPKVIDWRARYSHFLENVTTMSAPPSFEGQLAIDLQTLRSARWWNWSLHSIRMWWHAWYWHGLVLALAWLGSAFYLDWTRRLDATFTRILQTNYLAGLLILLFTIAIWLLPAALINDGLSVRSGSGDLTAAEAAAILLVLPYLFVIGHQVYRCYLIYHDRMVDLVAREVQEAVFTKDWRTRARIGWKLYRQDLRLDDESHLRVIFVVSLIGALWIFYLLIFHHGSL
ncbi:MAG TPA: hypothetical protein VGO11_16985 [Chthoniobacteraceae bacterium]|jgi:cellulose biosynthesis protein BcsQ|nr:hypothetical protein [Chthoniobacteraceae bacterium]